MEHLSKYLKTLNVKLSQLLLDPNNPRFAELGDAIDVIPESRFSETKIQLNAYDKMKSERFNVSELRDTIKTIGFLPTDKIIVRSWKFNVNNDNQLFVVVEGNRRVTALKWLIDLHESAKENFSDEILSSFQNLNVLELDQDQAPSSALWILPGLRHVSGIKEWGPYQKARAVYQLRETGATAQEVAQSLGLSTRSANQLWRSYLALEQMKRDEEYGEYTEPKLYSYFEEIFKKPVIRDWAAWSDTEKQFTNISNIREMYSWIIGDIESPDDDDSRDPKLPEAKSIRELGPILQDSTALEVFRSPNGTLTKALAKYEADHPEEWEPVVINCISTLANLSTDKVKSLSADDIILLEKLEDRIGSVKSDREKLLK